ncbi:DUF3619 family protein [Curvibacter sp. RS43]|jgi:hypothetical protein|uniref:DUF3619 family protein n=1 Tax=Curvibacter microcysteis TaxID=3026419 RepID=A0ABT5MD06_9BURK|nr:MULTISPECIES: DUF3619 family protein [unclassified Curvibacter]MDD0809369.1 DUF3619 family protein [Curvibacter sp. RS43]MDD0814466.1 DUF3619 family protein [Curvibacter sp. HBC28]
MKTLLQHPPSLMAAEDILGRRIAARLDASTQELPYDVSERLRAARMQALAKRKAVAVHAAPAVVQTGGGVAALNFGGGDGFGLWGRLASAIPLLALVAGLFVIQNVLDDDRVNEIAEVDAALLTDDLPPQAYADPGFLQFLKTQASEVR